MESSTAINWKKLTKKELGHLIESGITTVEQMQQQVKFMKATQAKKTAFPCYPCYNCKKIAIKMGLWDSPVVEK